MAARSNPKRFLESYNNYLRSDLHFQVKNSKRISKTH